MTLVFNIQMIPHSLTVPDEAVRGLAFNNRWVIYISDPSTMAVSQFRLPRKLEMQAAEELDTKRLSHTDGKKFLAWLLGREFIGCERVESEGRPSQFPDRKVAGPKPSMDRPEPTTSAPVIPQTPPVPVDLNPADKPALLRHPMDRPADLSF